MRVQVRFVDPLDVARLTLDHPKGNVLDGPMIEALTTAVEQATAKPKLRAIVLDAAGKDFSFGASVEEHLPPKVGAMLAGIHRLFVLMVRAPVPVLVAVQGRCLGGGLELALAGSRIFAAPDAVLGQPEVKLGVFAPAASALLPGRVGAAAAEELLLSGRTVAAAEALALGLVDEVVADPAARALAWVEQHLLSLSVGGLRFACRAARLQRTEAFVAQLKALERLYLDELAPTADAREGLSAFLEKRSPRWAQ